MSRADRRIPLLERQLEQEKARYDALVTKVIELGLSPREALVVAEPAAPAWPNAITKAIADTGLEPRSASYRALMTWVSEALASDVAEHEIVAKIKRGWSEELDDDES